MDAKTIATGLIKVHEGLKLTLYADSVGLPTIGYGRSLATKGISIAEANVLLEDDVDYFLGKLSALPWFAKLDDFRQAAVIDMAFNLGLNGLLEFKEMIAALDNKFWTLAAQCCLDSEWAKEVGERAHDIAYILAKGQLPGS